MSKLTGVNCQAGLLVIAFLLSINPLYGDDLSLENNTRSETPTTKQTAFDSLNLHTKPQPSTQSLRPTEDQEKLQKIILTTEVRDGSAKQESELWLINTRSLARNCPGETMEKIWIHRYTDCAWEKRTVAEFMQSGENHLPTCFVIHGNQTTNQTACQMGMIAFHRLKQCSDQPIRVVVWSWPSEKAIRGLRKDLMLKSERSGVQGFYLAGVIEQLPTDQPVGFIGYSFGAKIAASALQLLNQGSVDGQTMKYDTDDSIQSRDYRAVLFAAGMRNYDIIPGRKFGKSMESTNRLLITRNCKDFTLKLYPHIAPYARAQALGYTGLAGRSQVEALGTEIEEYSVANSIGKEHNWKGYFNSSWLMNKAAQVLFQEKTKADE